MLTFPFTPAPPFEASVRVGELSVLRYGTGDEQRVLGVGQVELALVYTFPRATPAPVLAGISSFYLHHGGPRDPFLAVDHRTGSVWCVRFLEPELARSLLAAPGFDALRVAFRSASATLPASYAPTSFAAGSVTYPTSFLVVQ